MEIFGFCILVAVVYAADTWLYAKGYNTMCHSHKTDTSDERMLLGAVIRKATAEARIAEGAASTYGCAKGGRDA